MKVEPHQFSSLIKKGYSLDHIYLLQLIKDEIDISKIRESNVKIEALHSTLLRKNLIVDNNLTLEGKHLLAFLDSDVVIALTRLKVPFLDFDKWWTSYPGTDSFVVNGRTFTGCRSLRQNKSVCAEKFNKIILEGEYTAEQLIAALLYDVDQKKRESIKQGSNKLTFMQNSLTYLNQRSFESFIELIAEGKITETFVSKGSFDI